MRQHTLLILLIAIAALAAPAGPASAQSSITIEDAGPAIDFPNGVTFRARVSGPAPIARVLLEYGVDRRGCGEVLARAYPELSPAEQGDVEWSWNMERTGSEPPGATIWYRWRIFDADGESATSGTRRLSWLDGDKAWQQIAQGDVTIHWYEGSRAFAEELLGSAAGSLADLGRATGVRPQAPIQLYVYANTQAMRDSILGEPGWTGGVAFPDYNITIIGISREEMAWGKRTIAHELTHLLVGQISGSCARPGRLESSEGGLALGYPTNWKLEEQTEELGTLAQLTNPNQTAYAVVYQSLRPTDRSLKSAAQSAHNEVYGWFEEVGLIVEEPYTLDDGTPAWRSEFGGVTEGVPIYIMMVTAAQGTRLVTLVTYCAAVIYEYEYETLETIAKSMRLSSPRVAGVNRDEAIVSVAGESANPRSYDPAYGGGHPGVFSGLLSFSPELGFSPDLAEGWEIGEGGTVYTFHLRPNARFHDGRRLAAGDVVYSWQRALAPATGSPVALAYLGDILGAREYRAGAVERVAGLEALDERTLRVTIDGPKPYFLQKLTAPAAVVVDRANVESGPEWHRFPNGSGPYRLIRWEPGEYMLLERSERFYLEPPAVRYQVRLLYGVGSFPLYEFDYVDIMDISASDKARASDPADPIAGQLFEQPSMCTRYVAFDASRPPFDDPLVRRAFALAVDRGRFRDVAGGDALLARGLYPPALPGHDPALAGPGYDPAAARQPLAESSYEGPAGLPPLTLTTGGYGGEVGPGVGALARMWQEQLGVSVTVALVEPGQLRDDVYGGEAGDLVLWSWCADYPDPENFADLLFHSGSTLNVGRYADPALDALLERARTQADPAARIGLYQQAERAIVDGAAGIFLTHPLSRVFVKPRVQGYALAPIPLPLERYLSIAPSAEPAAGQQP